MHSSSMTLEVASLYGRGKDYMSVLERNCCKQSPMIMLLTTLRLSLSPLLQLRVILYLYACNDCFITYEECKWMQHPVLSVRKCRLH